MKPKLRIAGESEKALPRKINLTQATVPLLACPAGKTRVRIFDAKSGRLALMVTAAGRRSWYWCGRVKGLVRPVDYHIGDADAVPLADARRIAATVAAKAAEGIDPRAERDSARQRAKSAVTVQTLWERYRKHLEQKGSPATLRTDDSRYKLHLSAWKNRPVQDITREDVRELHNQLTNAKTENIADKTIKLLRRMLTFAEVSPNPAGARAVKFHGDVARDRFLSAGEIERLSAAMDECINQTVADALRFALLTGARRGNICGARWQDIHLGNGLWIIPRDQSKNKKPMPIALVPAAIALLRRRRDEQAAWLKRRARRYRLAEPEDCPYVFQGRTPDEPVKELKTTWQAVCKAAKIEGVRIHDLRHTLASHMAMGGASLLLIGKQLGHANKQSTMRYSHLELDAVRPATEAAVTAMFGGALKPKPGG